MERPDFEVLARAAAGDRWTQLDTKGRVDAVLDAKHAWLDAEMGADVGDQGFATWFNAQPEAVQNEMLGTKLAAAYRAGKHDRFVDVGPSLTLEQLDARGR